MKGCGDVKPKHIEKKHHGSYMAKQQLYNIAKKAQSVHDRLGDNEQLEDWMESKIAQMADNIDSVSNSFDYDEHEDHHEEEVITLDLGEEIMSGLQSGYADDSESDNAYDFQSKGALGSQPELGEEGFTEPETNYSKIKKGYNFDSDVDLKIVTFLILRRWNLLWLLSWGNKIRVQKVVNQMMQQELEQLVWVFGTQV